MSITEITELPDSIGSGAQVSFTMSTARNMSESGNTGRKSLRPIKRNYQVAISPEDSAEMQAIIMATRGDRYPLALVDTSACVLTNEVCPHNTIQAQIVKNWTPVSGTLTFAERVLYIDQRVSALTVMVNGSPLTTGGWELADFGRINFSPSITSGDVVTVTGRYFQVVAMLDPPALNLITTSLSKFESLRFEQIFEPELINLTAT